MIDWQIKLKNGEFHKEDHWYFPDFRIQEFMLPILNVGFDYIDEYSDTSFEYEDCRRLVGNLTYLDGILETRQRADLQFDSLNDGVVLINKQDIETCVRKLLTAVKKAMDLEGTLKFFGD